MFLISLVSYETTSEVESFTSTFLDFQHFLLKVEKFNNFQLQNFNKTFKFSTINGLLHKLLHNFEEFYKKSSLHNKKEFSQQLIEIKVEIVSL